jgi:hypothetical protein
MVNWLHDQALTYFEASKAEKFKLHNFRVTAMSKARMARIADSDAAVAFGCNPQTMRDHYHALDEVEIADDVFSRMQGGIEGPFNSRRRSHGFTGPHSARPKTVGCEQSHWIKGLISSRPRRKTKQDWILLRGY